MSPSLELDDEELRRITRRKQPAAQARFLAAMRVPYRRRCDGTLLVGRTAMEQAMLGAQPPATAETVDDAGIQWKVTR
ncbi:DUF4224 domain-containing protein [Variovorax paradoxus]|nr:DUF4224 domain-containing protein [Variovorax paradoxus]